MEDQHPIPQDVTGFQFKLIGSMTVKQFGYVAVGVILAVITWYFPLHSLVANFFKVLFVPIFGASGFIVAFLPLEGRPIDLMAINFIKAIFSPNQYVYHKATRHFSFMTIKLEKPVAKGPTKQAAVAHTSVPTSYSRRVAQDKNKKLQAFLRTTHPHNRSKLDDKEDALLETFGRLSSSSSQSSAPAPAPMILSGRELPSLNMQHNAPTISFSPPPTLMQQPVHVSPPQSKIHPPQEEKKEHIEPPKPKEATPPAPVAPVKPVEEPVHTNEKFTNLQRQLEDAHSQKLQLETELTKLRNQITSSQKTVVTPSEAQEEKPKQSQRVRNIPQPMSKSAGLAYVPDTPNVVVGIVKDPRGNVLPAMLVEIKDKEGNPVRAFKTNALGQFASATPLALGTYTIELEDPKKQHAFDVIQITANNEILSPIEIISHDAREELRKALFN